jgi:lysozyme
MQVRQTPSASETLLTLYGNLKPNKSGATVKIQVDTNGKWTTTRFATKVTKVGTWKVTALATALEAQVRYRAVTEVSGRTLYSLFVESLLSSNRNYQMQILRNL